MAPDEILISLKEQLIHSYAKLMVVQGTNLLLGDENSPDYIKSRVSTLEWVIDLLEESKKEG